jgi:hypothetical protein
MALLMQKRIDYYLHFAEIGEDAYKWRFGDERIPFNLYSYSVLQPGAVSGKIPSFPFWIRTTPDLEYIIVDGGSTDNSVEIIKKCARQRCYWARMLQSSYHAVTKIAHAPH